MLSKCFKIVVMCTDQREFGRVCCCGWQRARGFLLFTLTCQWLGLELYALVTPEILRALPSMLHAVNSCGSLTC